MVKEEPKDEEETPMPEKPSKEKADMGFLAFYLAPKIEEDG